MELKGSKTEQNLLTAFAGESQARGKYTYYAQKAREEGMEQIARFFEERLPQRLGVCHCTGTDKYALFHQCFGDRTFYNYTGRIEIL